jgi:hypothetical protein
MATGDRGTTTIEQQDSMNGLGMDSETYADSLDKLFPGAVDEASFIEAMSRVVGDKGFNPLSAINLVSTCRDEICRPFTEKLDEKWSEYVIISGVQIHGALGHNFWWPGSVTHFANGVETDLSGDYEKAISQYSLSQWVNAKASDHAQQSAGMRLPSLLADAV